MNEHEAQAMRRLREQRRTRLCTALMDVMDQLGKSAKATRRYNAGARKSVSLKRLEDKARKLAEEYADMKDREEIEDQEGRIILNGEWLAIKAKQQFNVPDVPSTT